MCRKSSSKRTWRAGLIFLLLLAVAGPWTYDKINVPAEYACAVRLYGDFCGIPLSGFKIFSMMAGGLGAVSLRLVTGETPFLKTLREFLFALGLLFLFLPILSNLILTLREDQGRFRWFHLALLILALCLLITAVLFGMPAFSGPIQASWGILLYTGLLSIALVYELFNLFDKQP
jgi:hypothetical protein